MCMRVSAGVCSRTETIVNVKRERVVGDSCVTTPQSCALSTFVVTLDLAMLHIHLEGRIRGTLLSKLAGEVSLVSE